MGDRRWRLCYGAARFAVVLGVWAVVVPAGMAVRQLAARARGLAGVGGRPGARVAPLAHSLPVLAEWLGPAYVKFAQLASTREDVVPPEWCRAMAALREDGDPLPTGYLRRQLAAHGLDTDQFRLIGAGSVACVYAVPDPGQAAPTAGSRLVAVKVLRPRIRAAIARDLQLLTWGARVMARLPRMRHLPVVDMVDHIAGAIAGQVDLVREKANLSTLHDRLDPARICVPAPRSGGAVDVLVMDYVPEFAHRWRWTASTAGQREAAHSLVDAVFRMLFAVGVVHCDLHPGNLRVTTDGRVCIVDAGFVVTTDETLRRQFCEFFLGLSLGNGPRCAKTIVDAAVSMPPGLDRPAFDAEVTDIVHRYTGLAAGDFSIVRFVDELFALQRRHRIFVSAAFVVPILTLLVIEGTVRSWDPALDFQTIAQPIILSALVRLSGLTPDKKQGPDRLASRTLPESSSIV